jgi:hypothetical protein
MARAQRHRWQFAARFGFVFMLPIARMMVLRLLYAILSRP